MSSSSWLGSNHYSPYQHHYNNNNHNHNDYDDSDHSKFSPPTTPSTPSYTNTTMINHHHHHSYKKEREKGKGTDNGSSSSSSISASSSYRPLFHRNSFLKKSLFILQTNFSKYYNTCLIVFIIIIILSLYRYYASSSFFPIPLSLSLSSSITTPVPLDNSNNNNNNNVRGNKQSFFEKRLGASSDNNNRNNNNNDLEGFDDINKAAGKRELIDSNNKNNNKNNNNDHTDSNSNNNNNEHDNEDLSPDDPLGIGERQSPTSNNNEEKSEEREKTIKSTPLPPPPPRSKKHDKEKKKDNNNSNNNNNNAKAKKDGKKSGDHTKEKKKNTKHADSKNKEHNTNNNNSKDSSKNNKKKIIQKDKIKDNNKPKSKPSSSNSNNNNHNSNSNNNNNNNDSNPSGLSSQELSYRHSLRNSDDKIKIRSARSQRLTTEKITAAERKKKIKNGLIIMKNDTLPAYDEEISKLIENKQKEIKIPGIITEIHSPNKQLKLSLLIDEEGRIGYGIDTKINHSPTKNNDNPSMIPLLRPSLIDLNIDSSSQFFSSNFNNHPKTARIHYLIKQGRSYYRPMPRGERMEYEESYTEINIFCKGDACAKQEDKNNKEKNKAAQAKWIYQFRLFNNAIGIRALVAPQGPPGRRIAIIVLLLLSSLSLLLLLLLLNVTIP